MDLFYAELVLLQGENLEQTCTENIDGAPLQGRITAE